MELEKVKDIKLLTRIASNIWHEYWPGLLSEAQIDYMVEKFQSEDAILKQIMNEKYTYYFIVENRNIIGYTGISDKKDYLFLSKLYLLKEYRHKGYGRKAFDKIKELGFDKIRLTVNKYNTNAYNAYLKYGFKVIDSVVTDIGSGFVMDDYIMEFSALE